MQTFLPYGPNFIKTAECLDNRRLNKQIVEALQIYNIITHPSSSRGWHNHPAVKMWRGYADALAKYGFSMYVEWKLRFLEGDRGGKIEHVSGEVLRSAWYDFRRQPVQPLLPDWLFDPRLYVSHREVLLYKAPDWYGQWGWIESPAVPDKHGRLPYWWPTNDNIQEQINGQALSSSDRLRDI